MEGCGATLDQSCASLEFTATLIKTNDIIRIAGNSDVTYDMCTESDDVITFPHIPSKIEGTSKGSRPRVGCYAKQFKSQEDAFATLQLFGSKSQEKEVVLENLLLENVALEIQDIEIIVVDSVLTNTSLRSNLRNCGYLSVKISRSIFHKQHQCGDLMGCETLGDQRLVCRYVDLSVSQSQFYDTKLMVYSALGQVNVDQTKFAKILPYETGLGGLNVTFGLGQGSLRVTKSTFLNHAHVEPILSAMNIETSSLRVETWGTSANDTNATVIIQDTLFENNERAVSISRYFKYVEITRCHFTANHAMHAGAALRLALDYHLRVLIRDSVFQVSV